MFHVPERARNTTHPILGTTTENGNNGAFDLESPEPGWCLALICSDGTEAPDKVEWQWEHVSIHAYRSVGHFHSSACYAMGPGDTEVLVCRKVKPQQRTPTWKEMSFVKDLCWDAEDIVLQFHPRKSEYVNNHPHVLHLWRPKHAEIPMPPPELVGVLT